MPGRQAGSLHAQAAPPAAASFLPLGCCSGRALSVPASLKGTLEKRYGPTWRTPAYLDKGADTGKLPGSQG